MSDSIKSHGNTSSGSGYNKRALPSRYLQKTVIQLADACEAPMVIMKTALFSGSLGGKDVASGITC